MNNRKKLLRPLSLLLCALLLCTLCACKKTEPAPAPDDPTPDVPVTPDEPVTPDDPTPPADPGVTVADDTLEKTVADDEGNTLAEIKLTVPKPENMAEAQQYYRDWMNDTAYYCEQDAADAAELRATQLSLGNEFFPFSYEASYETLRNDGKLLSFYRTYYTNTGGVHPNTTTMAETFVVETGALLVLDDVFSVAADEYLPRLMEQIKPMMDEKEQSFGGTMYYDGVRDALSEHYAPQNFALTDDSLLIFFPVYDIAPYAAGEQAFYIPLTALDGILNPAWAA